MINTIKNIINKRKVKNVYNCGEFLYNLLKSNPTKTRTDLNDIFKMISNDMTDKQIINIFKNNGWIL
jgi:hypothetical protein